MYGTGAGSSIGGIPELIGLARPAEPSLKAATAQDLKKKIEKLWATRSCAGYSANCKDISFDTIDEYYEKIMKVYCGENKQG